MHTAYAANRKLIPLAPPTGPYPAVQDPCGAMSAEWSQINFLRLEPLQFRVVEPKEVLTDRPPVHRRSVPSWRRR